MGGANAALSFATFGIGSGAVKGAGVAAVLKHVGKAVVRDAAIGALADAGIETARQLITGTKITNLEYDRITEAGIVGGIVGGGSTIVGAALEGLARTRVVKSAVAKFNKAISKGADAIKSGFAKTAGKSGKTATEAAENVVKGSSNIVPSQQQMHDAVTQWAKMKQSIASNRQLNKFKAATVVFDSVNDKYYYGMNRGIRMKGEEIDEVLSAWLPKHSLNHLPVGNCAEVDAINQALKAKADVKNLYMYTIDVETYLPKAMCDNCIYTFADRVAEVFSH